MSIHPFSLCFTSFIHPRCDKSNVASCFIFSNLNSSLTLEFDDSVFLFYFGLAMNLTTRISPSFFSFLITYLLGVSSLILEIPDDSLVINSNNWDLSFLFLRSWMSPHVMYGNAVWFLGLSRGIGHVYSNLYRCTAIHNTCLWVP